MLGGVGIVCFVGSYLVALGLEISRLIFKNQVRGIFLIGWVAAGLLAHSLFLYHHAVYTAGLPLASQRDWYLVAAWGIVALNLVLMLERPKIPFGLVLLPTALAFIAVGVFFASPEPFPKEPASRFWGMVHGLSILAGVLSVVAGFLAGAAYSWQARRLKSGRPPFWRVQLPSLEWLERFSTKCLFVAMLLLAIGVVSGIVLGRVDPARNLSPYDPFVGGTFVLLAWLIAANVGLFIFRGSSSGRRVALVTAASFLFLAAILAVGLFGWTRHGGLRSGDETPVRRTEER